MFLCLYDHQQLSLQCLSAQPTRSRDLGEVSMQTRGTRKRDAETLSEDIQEDNSSDSDEEKERVYDLGDGRQIVANTEPTQGCYCPICDVTLGDSVERNIKSHINSVKHTARAAKLKDDQQKAQQAAAAAAKAPAKKAKRTDGTHLINRFFMVRPRFHALCWLACKQGSNQ